MKREAIELVTLDDFLQQTIITTTTKMRRPVAQLGNNPVTAAFHSSNQINFPMMDFVCISRL